MEAFGDRVRRAREYAGLSQAELAARIGIKQQAIEYLENPRNNAQASRHTSEIARLTGVDAGWLAKNAGPAPGAVLREPSGVYKNPGPAAGRKALSDAEKLLAIVQAFLNTDARGRDALYGQALAVTAADKSRAAQPRARRRG